MEKKINGKTPKTGKTQTVPKKNKRGQPTLYRKKYCQRIINFFDKTAYSIKMIGNKKVVMPVDLPLLEDFAKEIGVHRATIHEWSTALDKKGKLKHPEFSDAIKKAKDMQKSILIHNGLNGGYDKTFAIFTAKNVTDMKDQVEAKLPEGTVDTLVRLEQAMTSLANRYEK